MNCEFHTHLFGKIGTIFWWDLFLLQKYNIVVISLVSISTLTIICSEGSYADNHKLKKIQYTIQLLSAYWIRKHYSLPLSLDLDITSWFILSISFAIICRCRYNMISPIYTSWVHIHYEASYCAISIVGRRFLIRPSPLDFIGMNMNIPLWLPCLICLRRLAVSVSSWYRLETGIRFW